MQILRQIIHEWWLEYSNTIIALIKSELQRRGYKFHIYIQKKFNKNDILLIYFKLDEKR